MNKLGKQIEKIGNEIEDLSDDFDINNINLTLYPIEEDE